MKYLALDIETTGVHDDANILEVFMILEDTSKPLDEVLEKAPQEHWHIKHNTYNISPFLIDNEEYGTMGLIKACELCGQTVDFVGTKIINMLKMIKGFDLDIQKTGRILTGGKNAAKFDIPMICKEFQINREDFFHQRTVDPTFYFIEDGDIVPPSMKQCLERASIDEVVGHSGRNDTIQFMKLVRYAFKEKGIK